MTAKRPRSVVLHALFPILAAALAPGTHHRLAAEVATPDARASFDDLVQVELVQVDVVAEGADGEAVLDLGRHELRLYQDGVPVEIGHFTPPIAAATATADGDGTDTRSARRPGGAAAEAGRRLVLFVDQVHLHANSRRRVFGRLLDLLGERLGEADEVMVVSYTGATDVLLPMSRDRRSLERVLREQAGIGAVNLLADNADRRALETIRAVRNQYAQGGRGADQACRDVGHVAEAHARQVHDRVLGTVAALERFVDSLAGYPGPKMLLHVSDGIPLVAGEEAFRFAAELCDGTGASRGVQDAIDTTVSNGLRYEYWDPTRVWASLRELDTSAAWTRLASHANTYQVGIYPFQARRATNRAASTDPTRTSLQVEVAGERNRQDALFLLADETGGEATLGGGDVERALAAIDRDARVAYQLAFTPPGPPDGERHRIRVEVTRPGVEVRYRRSYQSRSHEERVGDRVRSALLHGAVENPLGVRLQLTVADVAPGASARRVVARLRVPFDGLVLLDDGERRTGLVTVFVAARDGRGRTTPIGHQSLPIAVAGEGFPRDGYTYEVELPLPGAGGEVAVAVQDRIGGETSYLRESLGEPGS